MEKMKELYEKVANDKELQAKFFEIMKDAEKAGESVTSEKLISFAKDVGYDITPDEMKDFFSKLAESKEGQLTDAELDIVAGGKSDQGIMAIVASVFTLGIGCALGSIVQEIVDPTSCASAFE